MVQPWEFAATICLFQINIRTEVACHYWRPFFFNKVLLVLSQQDKYSTLEKVLAGTHIFRSTYLKKMCYSTLLNSANLIDMLYSYPILVLTYTQTHKCIYINLHKVAIVFKSVCISDLFFS